jgi:MFS transporter, BCD family, chlorophyll transporter
MGGLMLRKRFQLGLIHVAVAMTLVPINSTLNRVMIKELALTATLVAVLASLPYLFSPIQVAIGSFADRHPVFGRRRTPYIMIGLLLCVAGVIVAPHVAFLLAEDWWAGLGFGILAFGAWGMGFNFATVSYLSLASEISGEGGRSRTIAIMFFMMIVGIILTSIVLSNLVDPYTPEALVSSFFYVGVAALALGLAGLFKLEDRVEAGVKTQADGHTWSVMAKAVFANKQASLFFVYLIILLVALLGQDILLEPYGGQAFGMAVRTTTRITSVWGVCVLATLIVAGALERRVDKKTVARWGGVIAMIGFVLIAGSGLIHNQAVFWTGVILLGGGTGLSTVSNLSLMLDMTTPNNVGLFIGAWGMANAISRLLGFTLSGAVRDVITHLTQDNVTGYVVVFSILALMLLISLLMLRQINVSAFHKRAQQMGVVERAALVNEA